MIVATISVALLIAAIGSATPPALPAAPVSTQPLPTAVTAPALAPSEPADKECVRPEKKPSGAYLWVEKTGFTRIILSAERLPPSRVRIDVTPVQGLVKEKDCGKKEEGGAGTSAPAETGVHVEWEPQQTDGLIRTITLREGCYRISGYSDAIYPPGTASVGENRAWRKFFYLRKETDKARADGAILGGICARTEFFETEAGDDDDEWLITVRSTPLQKTKELKKNLETSVQPGPGRSILDSAEAVTNQALSAVADYVVEKAKQRAINLARDIIKTQACDKLTTDDLPNGLGLRGGGQLFPETCAVVLALRLEDIAASGTRLLSALERDTAKLAASIIQVALAKGFNRSPLVMRAAVEVAPFLLKPAALADAVAALETLDPDKVRDLLFDPIAFGVGLSPGWIKLSDELIDISNKVMHQCKEEQKLDEARKIFANSYTEASLTKLGGACAESARQLATKINLLRKLDAERTKWRAALDSLTDTVLNQMDFAALATAVSELKKLNMLRSVVPSWMSTLDSIDYESAQLSEVLKSCVKVSSSECGLAAERAGHLWKQVSFLVKAAGVPDFGIGGLGSLGQALEGIQGGQRPLDKLKALATAEAVFRREVSRLRAATCSSGHPNSASDEKLQTLARSMGASIGVARALAEARELWGDRATEAGSESVCTPILNAWKESALSTLAKADLQQLDAILAKQPGAALILGQILSLVDNKLDEEKRLLLAQWVFSSFDQPVRLDTLGGRVFQLEGLVKDVLSAEGIPLNANAAQLEAVVDLATFLVRSLSGATPNALLQNGQLIISRLAGIEFVAGLRSPQGRKIACGLEIAFATIGDCRGRRTCDAKTILDHFDHPSHYFNPGECVDPGGNNDISDWSSFVSRALEVLDPDRSASPRLLFGTAVELSLFVLEGLAQTRVWEAEARLQNDAWFAKNQQRAGVAGVNPKSRNTQDGNEGDPGPQPASDLAEGAILTRLPFPEKWKDNEAGSARILFAEAVHAHNLLVLVKAGGGALTAAANESAAGLITGVVALVECAFDSDRPIGDKDTRRTEKAANRCIPSDPLHQPKPGGDNLLRRNAIRALSIVGTLASVSEAPVNNENRREARNKQLGKLFDSITDRSKRDGDFVVSISALAGSLGSFYRADTALDVFQLSLPLGLAFEWLPSDVPINRGIGSIKNFGYFIHPSFLDLGQYVAVTDGKVATLKIENAISLGGTVGILWGRPDLALSAGIGVRGSPNLHDESSKAWSWRLGLFVGTSVSLFDLN